MMLLKYKPTTVDRLRALRFARNPHALCSKCEIAKVGIRPGHRNCPRCKAATERMVAVVAWMRCKAATERMVAVVAWMRKRVEF